MEFKGSISWILLAALAVYHLCYVVITNRTETYAQPLQETDRTFTELYPSDSREAEDTNKTVFEDDLVKLTTSVVDNVNDLEIGANQEITNELLFEPEVEMYPEVDEMKSSIINGTFDWSKTARSILFLKKHKCASSTLREALRIGTISL